MKKLVLLLGAAAVVAGIWYFARQKKYIPPWQEPKTAKVTRGDIRVPITASGLINANQVVDIKSEASGRVISVAVVEGTYVHAGDKLILLDPVDEQRNVDRMTAERDRADALLAQARIAVDKARSAVDSAQARIDELTAQREMADFEWQKVSEAMEVHSKAVAGGRNDSAPYSVQEVHDTKARLDVVIAQQKASKASFETAKLNITDAERAVDLQQAALNAVQKEFEDAQQRLRYTTIVAPCDGIVTAVEVQVGSIVQSGKTGFVSQTLLKLADVSKKKVVTRIDDADFGHVLDVSPIDSLPDMPGLREHAAEDAESLEKRSGKVTITVDAFPDQTFAGRIERVEPQGKLNVGSSIIQMDVHVEITDEKQYMLPLGVQAQVEFTVQSAANVIRVPSEAVKSFEGQKGVFVKVPPGPGETWGQKFLKCRFGIGDAENTEVIESGSGNELKVDDEVYTKTPPKDKEDEEE